MFNEGDNYFVPGKNILLVKRKTFLDKMLKPIIRVINYLINNY